MDAPQLHRWTDEELADRLSVGGLCPQCDYDCAIYRDAVSDFPDRETHMLHCPCCTLTVQWEQRTAGRSHVTIIDAVGRVLPERAGDGRP
jgi:hypothetical protein